MPKMKKVATSAFRFSAWPVADQDAWHRAVAPPNLLNEEIGYACRWRPSTQELIKVAYGCWLAFLQDTGAFIASEDPAMRVNLARVTAYWASMEAVGLAPNTVGNRLQHLGDAIRAMFPSQDWQWLRLGACRVQAKAKPLRDKKARMQPAEDVLKLGLDMIHAAENDRFRAPVDRAVIFRDGLLICLFTLVPLRRANMAGIIVGEHLIKRGDKWMLSFDGSETKRNRPFEIKFPNLLVVHLDRYLAVHRPLLIKCSRKSPGPLSGLWISQHGTQMTGCAIALQIAARTKEEFGRPINPHLFRDIAATTIATADPTNVVDVMATLGHSSMVSSQKHYIRANSAKATKRHQALIDFLRDGASASA